MSTLSVQNITGVDNIAMNSSFLRNRIINGDMRIDQRNAGASVTPTGATVTYTLDRWIAYQALSSKFSVQQNAGSVTTPNAFTNYLGVVSLAATTPSATDEYVISQRIEGYNFSDLGWGAAGALSVTLSFWVRSSLTGTFGGAFQNNASNRGYVFSYTINSANTWEYKTISVPGDTTGTWVTNNGIGLRLIFDLGAGTTYKGAAGSWGSTIYDGVTNGVNVIGTNAATWYITGVQLEVGSVDTAFERRQYGHELVLCQRYYEHSYDVGVTPGTVTYVGMVQSGSTGFASNVYTQRGTAFFKVAKRIAPTANTYDSAGAIGKCNFPDTTTGKTATVIQTSINNMNIEATSAATTDTRMYFHWVANSEL